MFNDVLSLSTRIQSRNSTGGVVYTWQEKEVFCSIDSVRQSEFYQASASGFKPEIMFTIRTVDYSGEQDILYNSKRYKLIRTYNKTSDLMEIIAQGVVNNG